MPEKVIVKLDRKEVWSGIAKDGKEAIEFACADHPELKERRKELMYSCDDPVGLKATTEASKLPPGQVSTPNVDNSKAKPVANVDIKSRKPRADRGVPRKKEDKKRRRTTYYLIKGEVEAFEGKDALDKALAEKDPLVSVVVIIGGTIREVECQKRFILK